jgi:DNA-directed RNA polymerase specialized sigma24 family protein
LKNFLTNEQTTREAWIIQNSVKSLSPEGRAKTSRRESSYEQARDLLTDLTGGSSSSQQDDFSLDEKDALYEDAPDTKEVAKSNRKEEASEARKLFDTMMEEASSQIAALTGGRKDGFDTYLDLERALSKIPNAEQEVFTALYMENGELLNRPRSYADAEFLTGLSTQSVRTLERKAIEKLRPALGPSFFKRRQSL